MRKYPFALAAVLTLAIAVPSHAAEKPRPTQSNQNQTKKVWTNEDLDVLRSRGLISIVGPEVNETTPQTATAPPESAYPSYESRLADPEWYAKQAAELQAELEDRTAALQQQQEALALAADRITLPGLSMDKPSAGVTPDAGIAVLQAQVQDVQNQLDELSDLARHNGIPPGDLRS